MNDLRTSRRWHWLFWFIYFLVNHLIFSPNIFSPSGIAINAMFALHNAGVAYITLDWWIPKYYRQKKYALFLLATFSTIMLFTVFLLGSLFLFYQIAIPEVTNFDILFTQYKGPTFWSNFSGLTALAIPYFVIQRMEMERRTNKLEKEKLAAELQFLKSQLHPHFLFNALNNIYFLIKKDPDTAAEALAGFSNLLRFQLYDANNEYVALEKEIDYLQQFAEIAQLRKGSNFKVDWQLPKDTKNVQIAPLLLMPLIENAFKHGSNKNGYIHTTLELEDRQLHFQVANSIERDKSQGLKAFEEGGIGLSNIQKRLKLLYPNQHEFSMRDVVTDGVQEFQVDLTINW